MKSQGKVYVGLSGGVDSAVSAALLKKAGYVVIGVFIKVWQPNWIECSWKDERRDAMRVAARLGIPFVTLNLEKEYKKGVIDYMIAEYAAGHTPNPDVMCNREVKFGAFWKWAKAHGADFIATGHYAQVVKKADSKWNGIGASFSMLAGIDKNKDQSYFLWTLNQADLPHVLFPVGHLEKSVVRKLAAQFRLPNTVKKDSQGLCFIGKVDVKEFLSHYIKNKPGKLLNEKGKVIGTHPGALFFTLGERHGFTIDAKNKTPNDPAYYVVSKNVARNTITVKHILRVTNNVVTSKNDSKKTIVPVSHSVAVNRLNWVNQAPKIGEALRVRTRYRQPPIKARLIKISPTKATFELTHTTDPITPGQSLVIYDGKIGEECLGGGIIE